VKSLWLDFTLQEKIIYICCVHRSPSAPSTDNREISLKTIIDEMASSASPTVVPDLIIIGDFNFPPVEWADGLSHVASSNEEPLLVSFLSDHFHHQTVDKPTKHRVDQNYSLLDLVILSDPDSHIKNEFLPAVDNIDR